MIIFEYKSILPSDCTVTVLKIRTVQTARVWCTSNIPQLTFTRILLDDGFVGCLLYLYY